MGNYTCNRRAFCAEFFIGLRAEIDLSNRNYRLVFPFVCQALEPTGRGGLHERDNLFDRTYRGDYGHFVVPRIALAA
jgi:hypothetical protein